MIPITKTRAEFFVVYFQHFSLNSIPSSPSPTYQYQRTNVRFANITSNLRSNQVQASAIAVASDGLQTAIQESGTIMTDQYNHFIFIVGQYNMQ